MFKENNKFEKFESKVWLSSPTMHGPEIEYVKEAYETNWMSTVGKNINEVERMACEYIGCKYAVALSAGTASLHLAMKLAGIEAYGMPKVGHGALEGKKVLMVSEKKTALDVIYSRLGKLSKFALLIDDIENKDEFYKNLNNILETLNEKSIYNLEYNKDTLKKLIKTDIENINNSTNKLGLIANKIYDLNDYGISFYDMYKRCKKVDLNSELEVNIYNHIKEYIPSRIYCLKYNELESIYNVFKNNEILANLKSYITAIKGDNSYMVRIKQNLVDIELSEFTSKILDLKEKINTYNSLNLINKLFYKKNINNKV